MRQGNVGAIAKTDAAFQIMSLLSITDVNVSF